MLNRRMKYALAVECRPACGRHVRRFGAADHRAGLADANAPARPEVLAKYTPSPRAAQSPEDGDWLLFRRTYDGWGYSPLSQITAANVGNLQLVSTSPPARSRATRRRHRQQRRDVRRDARQPVLAVGRRPARCCGATNAPCRRHENLHPDEPRRRSPSATALLRLRRRPARRARRQDQQRLRVSKVANYRDGYYMSICRSSPTAR